MAEAESRLQIHRPLRTPRQFAPGPPSPADQDSAKTSPTLVSAVTVAVIWLPDLSKQYAVSIKGGRTGTFNGSLPMDGCWLERTNKNDSGTSKFITAVGGFLGTIFSAAGLGASGAKTLPAQEQVQANVPNKPFFFLFEINDDNKTLQ